MKKKNNAVDAGSFEKLTSTGKFRLLYAKSKEKDEGTPYLTAILVAIVVGISGVVTTVFLRPDFDILVVSVVIFGFLTPTTTSLLALLKTQETNEQTQETHLLVNSALDAAIENATKAAKEEGVREGVDRANTRTDELAATAAKAGG